MGIIDSVKGVFYKSDKEYAAENPEFAKKLEQKKGVSRRAELEEHAEKAQLKKVYEEARLKALEEKVRKKAEEDVMGKVRGSSPAGSVRFGGLEVGSRMTRPQFDSNKFSGQVINDQTPKGVGGMILRQPFNNYGKQARGFGVGSAFGGRSLFSIEPDKSPEQQAMEQAFQEGFITAKVNAMRKQGMKAYYQSAGIVQPAKHKRRDKR